MADGLHSGHTRHIEAGQVSDHFSGYELAWSELRGACGAGHRIVASKMPILATDELQGRHSVEQFPLSSNLPGELAGVGPLREGRGQVQITGVNIDESVHPSAYGRRRPKTDSDNQELYGKFVARVTQRIAVRWRSVTTPRPIGAFVRQDDCGNRGEADSVRGGLNDALAVGLLRKEPRTRAHSDSTTNPRTFPCARAAARWLDPSMC